MLSTLIKIRLVQSANTFRFSSIFRRKQFVSALIMLAFFVILFGATAWVSGVLGSEYSQIFSLTKSVIVGGGVALLFFAFSLFRNNDPLDSRKLYRYDLPPWKQGLSLVVATMFSFQFLVVTIFTVSLLEVHVTSAATGWLLVLTALLILGQLAVYIRIGSALATFMQDMPQVRFFLAFAAGTALLIESIVMVFWALTQDPRMTWAALSATVANLEYVPVFSPWFILPAAAAGDTGRAGMLILISVLFFVALLALWLLLHNKVRVPDFQKEPHERAGVLGIFALFPSTKTGAIGARSMKYWLTDPRYLVPAIALPLLPIFVTATLGYVGVPLDILVLIPIPIFSLMLGWSLHNDISTDGSAFWIHLASAGTERADRVGRSIPAVILWTVVVTVGGIVAANMVKDPWVFPILLGLSAAAFGAATGLSSISSVSSAYPTASAHQNPFRQPIIERGASSGAAIVLLSSAAFVAIPLAFALFGMFGAPRFFAFLAMGSGLLTGWLLYYIGIRYSSYLLRKRGPEIMAVIMNN